MLEIDLLPIHIHSDNLITVQYSDYDQNISDINDPFTVPIWMDWVDTNSNCIKSTIPFYRRSSENHMIMLMNDVLLIHTASKVIAVRNYDYRFFKCGAFLEG